MSTLRIEVDGGKQVRPGHVLTGRFAWQLDQAAPGLELRLIWHTEGKGTRDGQVIDTLRLETPPLSGEREFSFTLPAGPYSCSGRLISIVWALELVDDDDEASERVELTLGPEGNEIQLGAAD